MQLDNDSVEHRCRGRRKRAQGYQCRQHGGSSEGKGFVLAVLCHNLHVDLFRFLLCLFSFCVASPSPRTGMPFCFVYVLFMLFTRIM
jgi:hypothetical protein